MANNRARGRRGELMAAQRYGGRRISETGLPGPDVEIDGQPWEVKLTKNMGALLRGWLAQAKREGARGVLFKEDLGKWYVVVEADWYFAHESDDPSL